LLYELVVVLNGTLEESVLEKEIQGIEALLKQNGELQQTELWKKLRLAYPIRRCLHGEYVRFVFAAKGGFIAELESGFRVNPHLLRHLLVRLPPPRK